MPDDVSNLASPRDATEVAEQLVLRLEGERCDYAVGGAIALGYWAVPRGTLDVDVTLYLPLDRPLDCIDLLQRIGGRFEPDKVRTTLDEHGFCQIEFLGMRLDVFLPLVDFYATAKARRREVPLGRRTAWIWDAETLCIFKLLFYRDKDRADLRSILIAQPNLDRSWVLETLTEICGQRDPRIGTWQELCAEIPGEPQSTDPP